MRRVEVSIKLYIIIIYIYGRYIYHVLQTVVLKLCILQTVLLCLYLRITPSENVLNKYISITRLCACVLYI